MEENRTVVVKKAVKSAFLIDIGYGMIYSIYG